MLQRRCFFVLLVGINVYIFISGIILVYRLLFVTSVTDIKDTDLQPVDINKIINKTTTEIALELRNYNFKYSGVDRLQDLILESEGQPLRSLIVSTWRSGSTFLGEILNALPGHFYHYEPFLKYGIAQIRGQLHSTEAIKTIKNMFKCNFDNMEDYFSFGKTHLIQFSQNKKLWSQCNYNLCFNANFTTAFCKLFPFQSMKVLRVRLPIVGEILQDKGLNVKVVFLIRDPRGVMLSRSHKTYCPKYPDCWNLDLVCGDMVRDYIAARKLLQKYPDRLTVLRFEELAVNPLETTQRLFKFLGLSMMPEVENFINTHINKEQSGQSATFRVSRDVPFKWKNQFPYEYVAEIQLACMDAMYLWGYRTANNVSQMNSQNFNPVGRYSIQQ